MNKYLDELRDDALALHWNREAASRDSAEACFNLGRHYRDGIGVAVDSAQARQWYQI